MSNVKPLRYVRNAGDTVGLSELQSGETIDGNLIDNTALTEIGAALVDADEIPVYDTSAAGNRKSLLSRIWTYISGKLASPPAIGGSTPADAKFVNLEYTGTLTGGTGVINLGSGQVYKNAAGDVGLGTTTPNIYNVSFAGAYRGNFYSLVATNQGATNTSAFLNLSALAAGSSSIVFGNATDQRGQISVNSSSALSLWTRDSDTGFLTERLTVNNAGATTLTGNLSVTGNTTLGDASGDTVAIQAGTAALPTLIPNGDPNTGLWFPAADTIAASTAGSERLRIDSSGNVGIGATSPACKLHLRSTATEDVELRIGNQVSYASFIIDTSGYGKIYTPGGRLNLAQSSNSANTSVSFNTTVQNALTLDASGNLISYAPTTAPSLTVNNTMVFNLTSNTNLRVSVRGSDGVTRTANITLA